VTAALLRGRVAKLELLQGDRGVPSEQEFQDANALLQQRTRAALIISMAEVSGRTPDPEVVSFAEAAETDPRFTAAQDIAERYRRAKGYPSVTTERIAEHMARLREVAAFVEARGWESGDRLDAAKENDGNAGRRSFTRDSLCEA
jgi:hypothetical protein